MDISKLRSKLIQLGQSDIDINQIELLECTCEEHGLISRIIREVMSNRTIVRTPMAASWERCDDGWS